MAVSATSAFHGMSLREIKGMPMCGEATGVAMSYWWPASVRKHITHPLQAKIAFTQERYVRDVWERCPRWRWRKRAKLREALDHCERVTNLNLYPIWRCGLCAAKIEHMQRETEQIGARIIKVSARLAKV